MCIFGCVQNVHSEVPLVLVHNRDEDMVRRGTRAARRGCGAV